MARRTRRHPQVLGHRRDRERAAQPNSLRPRGGQTGLTRPPRPARLPPPAAPRSPSRDIWPAVGRPAARSGARAARERAGRRALTIVIAAAACPTLHSSSLRRTPSPGSLRPASSSRDFGQLAARDPSLPFLPLAQHWPPPGLSPRPTGQPGAPRRGRLEAGPRAPPHGGGVGSLSGVKWVGPGRT